MEAGSNCLKGVSVLVSLTKTGMLVSLTKQGCPIWAYTLARSLLIRKPGFRVSVVVVVCLFNIDLPCNSYWDILGGWERCTIWSDNLYNISGSFLHQRK